MEVLKMPRLRMAQLQTLTNGVLKTTEDLKEVAAPVAEVQSRFLVFKDGMTRSDASSDKETLDRTRDNLNTGFFNGVLSEQFFTHEPAVAKVLDQVVKITNDYGFGLSRLSYDEQTAQTDNMLKKLEALDLSALPSLSRWLEPIKTANENFKQVTDEYLGELNSAGETTAAYKAAEPLAEALNQLFTLLFAHAQVSGSPELTKAYKELVTLVDTYK
ncbi:DUF6261 family protein [Reichenbachiella ulvae]|uniref:DUF6261 family protein n=1 Tax=Reichenbachiella ulvae TaxID=2980104 RepID=A0ABT3CTU5_9BACT|nr:DUF6261 family protein [Reichenbachiella ulvae]MCV9387044.1 DUF6261 family protein [Reichenbachiella ulvae]